MADKSVVHIDTCHLWFVWFVCVGICCDVCKKKKQWRRVSTEIQNFGGKIIVTWFHWVYTKAGIRYHCITPMIPDTSFGILEVVELHNMAMYEGSCHLLSYGRLFNLVRTSIIAFVFDFVPFYFCAMLLSILWRWIWLRPILSPIPCSCVINRVHIIKVLFCFLFFTSSLFFLQLHTPLIFRCILHSTFIESLITPTPTLLASPYIQQPYSPASALLKPTSTLRSSFPVWHIHLSTPFQTQKKTHNVDRSLGIQYSATVVTRKHRVIGHLTHIRRHRRQHHPATDHCSRLQPSQISAQSRVRAITRVPAGGRHASSTRGPFDSPCLLHGAS